MSLRIGGIPELVEDGITVGKEGTGMTLAPLIVILALSATPTAAAADRHRDVGVEPAAIDLAQARQVFDDARAASEADAGRLWGFRLYGPTLFVDPETRFVVANEKDSESELAEKDGVYVGLLPLEENIANTATTWAGKRWTMLMWPIPQRRYARTLLLMHESFHRIQEELGFPGSNPANRHLESQEGRTLLRLEWRALAEALIRRGEDRLRAIEDALIFRAQRHSLHPNGALEERALEMNEGLAEYTGTKLSGWPEWIHFDRIAARLEREDGASSFVRVFAYLSGPAYGVLLDEAGVPWRKGLRSDSDLGTLLAEACDFRLPSDLSGEADKRAAAYDGASVIAEESDRAERQRRVAEEHQARFIDGPVLRLPLGQEVHYTFSPRGGDAFGEMGTVFNETRVTDVWGVLEVSKGALLSRDANGRMVEARVPSPPAPNAQPIEGDGWKLTLNDGYRIVPGSRPGDFTIAPPE